MVTAAGVVTKFGIMSHHRIIFRPGAAGDPTGDVRRLCSAYPFNEVNVIAIQFIATEYSGERVQVNYRYRSRFHYGDCLLIILNHIFVVADELVLPFPVYTVIHRSCGDPNHRDSGVTK